MKFRFNITLFSTLHSPNYGKNLSLELSFFPSVTFRNFFSLYEFRVISLSKCCDECCTRLANDLSGFFLFSREARIRFLCPTAVISKTLVSSTSHSFITRSIVSKFLFINVSILSDRWREISHSPTEGGRL